MDNNNSNNNSARKRIVSLAVVATLVFVATVIGVSVAAAKRARRDRNTSSSLKSSTSASSSSLRPVGSTGDVARPADTSANNTNATTTFVPAAVPEKAKASCCDPVLEPGQFGNPFCTEGAACCPDGTWSCSIGDGVSFPCGNETLTSGFGERCDDDEEKDDGDSDLVTTCCNPLEEPGQFGNPFCTEGAVCCPDGSWSCSIGDGVSFPCGGETMTSGFGKACALDCEICPEGFFDGCNSCACNIEGGPICTLKLCGPDLEPKTCNQEQLSSPPAPKCCDPADEPGQFGNPFCTEGAACCPDGSWSCSIGDGVSFPCGGETITSGFGERCDDDEDDEADDDDDDDDSKPKCCDPADEPGQFGNPFCTEGAACCPDGTWSCSIGDGKSFPCGGETITSGFGERCDDDDNDDDDDDDSTTCCDPLTQPGQFGNPFCIEGAVCCPDGSWSCSIGDGVSFSCGGKIMTEGFGKACELDCEVCPGGFFDGCNTCACTVDGGPLCTKKACGPDLEPKTCQQEPVDDEEVNCDTCDCGYNDGCNDCQCNDDGSISCTKRACVWQGIPTCLECNDAP